MNYLLYFCVGKRYHLPLSGTAEVRNLWAYSNFNIGGIWVFELVETDQEPVTPLGEQSSDDLELMGACSGPFEPSFVEQNLRSALTIQNCYLPPHDGILVKLVLIDELVFLEEGFNYIRSTQTFQFNHSFENKGPAIVSIMLDGVPFISQKYIYVYELAPASNATIEATLKEENQTVHLNFQNCSVTDASLTVSFKDEQGKCCCDWS